MARLGYLSFDSTTPIVEGTYEASKSAVDVALSALDDVLGGELVAYGLCRPPGHHAATSMIGGYCFFNNAAVAASEMARRLGGPVGIIDVDYRHGNGTQSIFYERDDVFYLSLHGSPERALPYLLGYPDERGVGGGSGWNHNVELEKGCGDRGDLEILARSLESVHAKDLVGLVVSLGVDTYENDPISDLGLTKQAYFPMARLLARLGLPTVVVQEGGYDQIDLDINVQSFLRGIGGLDELPSSERAPRGRVTVRVNEVMDRRAVGVTIRAAPFEGPSRRWPPVTGGSRRHPTRLGTETGPSSSLDPPGPRPSSVELAATQ